MHLCRCPFCGTRDETEFRYVAPAGKVRPLHAEASATLWAHYLYFQASPRGAVREVWCHVACGEHFLVDRNNVTHDVTATAPLPHRGAS